MPKTTLDGTKKKKQKLGKKKLAPTNATSTVFKSKSIVLLEQDVFRSDKGPVTKRQLTFRELTTQLRHYSANVRGDAVRGMNEILRDHPALLEMHAAELITALVPLLTDTEQAVRRAMIALFTATLPPIARTGALGAHAVDLRLHIQASMAHPSLAIRVDALEVLQLLLRIQPSALSPLPEQLLPSLVDLLAGGESGSGKLTIAIRRRLTTLHTLGAVLNAQLLCENVASTFGGGGGRSAGGRAAGSEAVESGERAEHGGGATSSGGTVGAAGAAGTAGMRSAPLGEGDDSSKEAAASTPWDARVFRYASWHRSAHGHGSSGSAAAAATTFAQLKPLPGVLANCWLESGVWLPGNGGEAPVESAIACCALFRQLLSLAVQWSATGGGGRGEWGGGSHGAAGAHGASGDVAAQSGAALAATLAPLILKHVIPHVPLPERLWGAGGKTAAGKSAGSGKPAAAVAEGNARWQRLNLSLFALACDVLRYYDSRYYDSASEGAPPSASKMGALTERLLPCLLEALTSSTDSRRAISTADASALVATMRTLLLASHTSSSARSTLLDALLTFWVDAPPLHALRPPLLELFAEAFLPHPLLAAALPATASRVEVSRGAGRAGGRASAEGVEEPPSLREALTAAQASLVSRSGPPFVKPHFPPLYHPPCVSPNLTSRQTSGCSHCPSCSGSSRRVGPPCLQRFSECSWPMDAAADAAGTPRSRWHRWRACRRVA